jgi:hypothetical protein
MSYPGIVSMNGLRTGLGDARTMRKTALEPPGYDRVVHAFQRSARLLSAAAGLALACGVALSIAGSLEPLEGLRSRVFLGAGAFLLVLSLLPFVLARRRRQRLAFLAVLRSRWSQLARAGDPGDQIAGLARAYAGLVGTDLRARLSAS